jgi:hypothetical protein
MIELLMIAAVVVAMGKIADIENRSALVWGALALVLSIGMMFAMPTLPYLRVGIAFVLLFILMMVMKAVSGR